MRHLTRIAVLVLLTLSVLCSLAIIGLLFQTKYDLVERIEKSNKVNEHNTVVIAEMNDRLNKLAKSDREKTAIIQSLEEKIDKIKHRVPKDGKNGVDGRDGKDGGDGKTHWTRCNTERNRWEERFSLFENWSVMNGRIVKCVVEEVSND